METEAFIQEPAAKGAAPRPISWYRSPLDSKEFKKLHEKSDLLGWAQSLGYLGCMVGTGALAMYSFYHGPWWATVLAVFVFGTTASFQLNGVHELCHNTVFKTKAYNALFLRILSFFSWTNFEMFQVSHARHHRYTLHQPDDLEVVLPVKLMAIHFFKTGFINLTFGKYQATIGQAIRVARGKFQGDWEMTLFPEGSPDRLPPIHWARFMLAGHAAIVAVSLYFHLWLLPVLTTLSPFYAEWLFFLCNNTQHIGLQDDVSDFRLCCRTFTVNPVVQFLYWHMNFHIEHHMYAAVPCYRLGRLHKLIEHDLPPCPAGIAATWREIAAIQKIQETNPEYQHVAPLPGVKSEPAAA